MKIKLIIFIKDKNEILLTNKDYIPSMEVSSSIDDALIDISKDYISTKQKFFIFDAKMNSTNDPVIYYYTEVNESDLIYNFKTNRVNIDNRSYLTRIPDNEESFILLDFISYYVKLKPGKFNDNLLNSTSAIGVFRLQPLHNGHLSIINRMIAEHDIVTIGIGSSNQPITNKNPWSFDDRKAMLRNIYGSRIRILKLNDLDNDEENAWADYVLEEASKLKIDKPTFYYSGSEYDAHWYKDRFEHIIICDREKNEHLSGTIVRDFLTTNNPDWEKEVPLINHYLVEKTFKFKNSQ